MNRLARFVKVVLGCTPRDVPRALSSTARLVGGIEGSTVLTLGDEAYPEGTQEEFEECY